MSTSTDQSTPQSVRADSAHAPDGQMAAPATRVSSLAGLLAAIPLLLGFQPSEPSIVVLGTVPPRSTVAVTLRYDIPDPQCGETIASHAAAILCEQGMKAACAIGYGPGSLVTPVAEALRAQFTAAGITVHELLRVQDGRYWSYVCTDPVCCPPEGTAFDPKEHSVGRRHADQVLASRQALAETLAPVTGDAAASMRKATRAARQRFAAVLAEAGKGERAGRRALREPGLKAVADAIALYRAGGKLESHDDAAWLALSLQALAVRDDAWARMLPEHRKDHLRLWTDLTTLARRGYAAAPASLLAFCAWQDGNGALANVALDRALADNPRYSMAGLLRQAIDAGAPPSMARLPMSPEEVAESYDEAERSAETAQKSNQERPEGDETPGGEEGGGEAQGSGAGDAGAATDGTLAGAPA